MTILTGAEIHRQWELDTIRIDPFDPERLNPNSYNFTLGDRLRIYRYEALDARLENPTSEIMIPDEGYVLEAGRFYLGCTAEILGGSAFAPTFSARSSIARLGLSIHLSSGLGDIGYEGQWTLQLLATHAVRVYAGMEIGQMMWWIPTGDITPYTGKYQGSRGPRASESFRCFDGAAARRRFAVLAGGAVDRREVGDKAATLARLAERVPVPPLVVVPVAEFASALPPQARAGLAAVFSDLRATVGADLTDAVARIGALLDDVGLSPRATHLLGVRLRELEGYGDRFAVRSSAIGEDSAGASHAGAYSSVLDVAAADVAAAVATVWRSYYSLPAVGARLRAGDLDPAPRMAVIVQRMIEPDVAGIAMTGLDRSEPGRVAIETAAGRADALAAGVTTPEVENALTGAEIAQIHALVDAARADLAAPGADGQRTDGPGADGPGVDVEWALAEGRVHLLQARPNTARRDLADRCTPAVISLYDEAVPADVPLGPLGPTCAQMRAKRARPMRLAARLGIARGAAFVVYVPADPPPGWYDSIATALDGPLTGSRVVLDVHEYERQIIVDYVRLPAELARIRAATPAGEPTTALVRRYVTGTHGLITRRAGDGRYYGEASADGLLAMNRGLARCQRFRFPDPEAPGGAAAALGRAGNVEAVTAFTEQAEAVLGALAVEWVVDADGTLYYVDHTPLGHEQSAGDGGFAAPQTSGAVVVAPGRCAGRVVRATDDEALQRLSVGPAVSVTGAGVDVSGHRVVADLIARAAVIRDAGEGVIISARRPYAILAALIGHVDGFVFDDASLLCHLGIMVRETGVPAYVHTAEDGDLLVLDAGTVRSFSTNGACR